MRYFSSLTLLCSIYLVTIFLGLNTAEFILSLMYPPAGQEQIIEPMVAEPESVGSSIQIFAYILAATLLLLFLMKRKWGFIIRIALFFSFLVGTFFTAAAFMGDLSLLFTPVMLGLVILRRDCPIISNVVLAFTISGIGAFLGASLGFTPALALLLLMSLYDIVAVFVTKHMLTLAEGAKGRFAFMFLIPVGDRTLGLGAGDIALPLTFVVSVFKSSGIGYAIPTAYGGLLGLVALFFYMQGKEKIGLPALPPITIGLYIGYLMSQLILG
jgi:presenilin-like A22 family membrane protease